jgi:hypothetical protein
VNLGFVPSSVDQLNLPAGQAPPNWSVTASGVLQFTSQATGTTSDTLVVRR